MLHFYLRLLLCFLFTLTYVATNPNLLGHHISINCGTTKTSAALSGKEWLPDLATKGSSSSTRKIYVVDPVPYNTARISRSQFSYTFQLNPGQKVIRLHFNPTSYHGFQKLKDFFTVEAGPFTLLANFSPSITARALAVNTSAKEFCIITQENQPLNIIFSPASHNTYAFINGIEIISVPSTLSYCHGGDIGVQVVGQKPVIHIDNATALEMVHRQNIKHDSVSLSADDIHGMFGMWEEILREKAIKVSNITWKVSVDVGFKYLIRLHFCELGLRMARKEHKDFIFRINHMIAATSSDIYRQREDESILRYKNYMVMVKGHKREGKRDIFISLHSEDEFLDGHSPLEGFEIFKLSNHDNNLASPTPLPPTQNSPPQAIQTLFSVLGSRNAITTVAITVICLINIVVHILHQKWGANFTTKEENEPSARAKRFCRYFSLAEIQSATENFNDAFVVGKGGFGKVYKGLIDNGQEAVAIKRLKAQSNQGKCEFLTEIEMLSELRHANLVSLVGYCNEQREMILVYEYVPCGTLADHLYKLARKNNACSSLSWEQRLKICIGAGRGLDYLHTGHGIIHRDIKASNILLTENFLAKVSDFGLAKYQSGSELQRQASANLKGTFGYFDPTYLRTRISTTKSDTYSFGVVLLEVLCGRPAVEPCVEEDKRSLTMWARDKISKGEVEQIVAPSMQGEISPNSLKAFVRVVERCLYDEPKKRPALANVVIELEFALEQNVIIEPSVPIDITQEKVISLVPNGITNVADDIPCAAKTQQEKAPISDRTILPVSTRQITMASFNVKNVTSSLREQFNSKMISAGKKATHKLSHLWPWNASPTTAKQSKKKHLVSFPRSAPISLRTSCMALASSTGPGNSRLSAARGSDEASPSPTCQILPQSNLRVFSFSELKAATRNFRGDTMLGEGGFGKVYKGWISEKSSTKAGSGSIIAVKRLNSESIQGFEEWQSYNAKISDFGLAKLGPVDDESHITTQVMGTYGYAAPEYIATGHLYVKGDVYGFGVILVEMITGLRAIDINRPSGKQNLVDWIKQYLCKGKMNKLKMVMDQRLEGRYHTRSVLEIAQLARRCLETKPKNRPSMKEIVETLVRINSAVKKARKPRVHFSYQAANQKGQQHRIVIHK